jgi:hypothetical protein
MIKTPSAAGKDRRMVRSALLGIKIALARIKSMRNGTTTTKPEKAKK